MCLTKNENGNSSKLKMLTRFKRVQIHFNDNL